MNDLFVILVQDKKVPSEGTLFWGAKNEDYLRDAFAEAGFALKEGFLKRI